VLARADAGGQGGGHASERGRSMSDRRRGERESTRRGTRREQESDERRQKERDLRSDELKEAWRRNHPSEEEDTDRERARRGRTGPA
jgi:hypothetical protein